MIAARGDEQDDGSGELEFGDALQLELDADEEQPEDGNGGGAHQVGAETEPAALDGGDGAVLRFGSPPSSPSPAVVLGAIGPASPSKLPGVIHRAKLGLGVVLHLKGDQEEGDARRRDTREQGLVLACAPIIDRPPSSTPSFSDAVSGFGDQDGVDDSLDSATLQDTARAVQDQEEEEMVHKCSDANWSTTDEASALEGQVEEESTVGDISAERGATVDDTDAKGQQLVDQDTSDQCEQTDEDIDVEEELVLEEGLDDKWVSTHNALTVQDWEKLVKQDECAANGNDIALEGQEKAAEQCTGGELGASMDDNAVGDQVMVDPEGAIGKQGATKDGITVEDQEKMVEQRTTDELGATDAVEDQEVAELGVITEMVATMDDNAVEDHEVVEQSVIDERHATTDDIAVEDQEKVVEQCAVNESRTTKDDNAVEEKEVVVEQGVIGKQGAMPMDDIAAKDKEKAVEQYVSYELKANKDENAVEEHKKVAEQGVINKSGGTKDENHVEELENVKEQGFIDKCDTANDGTALGVQKKAAELCIGDEQRAIKDVVAVHNQENMLEQSISDERGATKGEFTVEKRKEVVERVRHEWGATEDDLVVDTAASGGVSGISSFEVVSVTVNGSDGETVKKEKVKLCVGYPRRPGKLNCPFYMSTGCCSYGLSCHFNHPLLKAKSDVSSVPSEQGNHGVAEILELNRVGVPIREGARNCTYYMRNGTCRYGKKCHYNHPEQVIDAQFYPPTGWDDNALPSSLHLKKSFDHATLDDTSYLKSSDDATLGDTSYSKKSSDHAILDDTSYSKKSSDHATLDDTSYSSEVLPPNILRMLLPPQKVPPSTEEKVMKVKKDPDWSSASDDSDGCCSADSSDGPLCKQEHVDYPERPGRPECPFYMRFGDCKFASACKYDHSKDRFPSRYHSKDPSLGEELTEYPERPGELECPFYMRSRFCKFGAECKFHHPKDLTPSRWSPTTTKKSVAATNEHHPATRVTLKQHICQQLHYPERPGQPDCRYYMQFGKCKYLSACIFHHPKDRLPSGWHPSDPAHSDQYDTWQPTTNRIDDLCQQTQVGPEIPGMPECPFYMKTGTCQFGSACEFHHPKDRCSTTKVPSRLGVQAPRPRRDLPKRRDNLAIDYKVLRDAKYWLSGILGNSKVCFYIYNLRSSESCSSAFYIYIMENNLEAVHQVTDLAYDNFTRSENVLQQQEQTMYPERPGEPECSYYMRHGSCKFQMNCKYHHPRDRLSKKQDHFVSTWYC